MPRVERKSGSGPKPKSYHPVLFPGGPIWSGILSGWRGMGGDPVWGAFCTEAEEGQKWTVRRPKVRVMGTHGTETLLRKPGENPTGQWAHPSLGVETSSLRLVPAPALTYPSTSVNFIDSSMYLPPPHLILGGHWSHGIKYLGEELPQEVGVGPLLTGGFSRLLHKAQW